MLRALDRPVLVARHQQARRRIRRVAREPHALRPRGFDRDPQAGGKRSPRRRPDGVRRGLGPGPLARGRRFDRQAALRLGPHRLRQRDPRPYRYRRSALPRHSRHGRALRAPPRFLGRDPRRDADADVPCRPHPGRGDGAARHRKRQARHGRHDPRPSRRSAYRPQDHRGARARDQAVRRHGLLHRLDLFRRGGLHPQCGDRARGDNPARDRKERGAEAQGGRRRRRAGGARGRPRRRRARTRGRRVRGRRSARRAGADRRGPQATARDSGHRRLAPRRMRAARRRHPLQRLRRGRRRHSPRTRMSSSWRRAACRT